MSSRFAATAIALRDGAQSQREEDQTDQRTRSSQSLEPMLPPVIG